MPYFLKIDRQHKAVYDYTPPRLACLLDTKLFLEITERHIDHIALRMSSGCSTL